MNERNDYLQNVLELAVPNEITASPPSYHPHTLTSPKSLSGLAAIACQKRAQHLLHSATLQPTKARHLVSTFISTPSLAHTPHTGPPACGAATHTPLLPPLARTYHEPSQSTLLPSTCGLRRTVLASTRPLRNHLVCSVLTLSRSRSISQPSTCSVYAWATDGGHK